MDTEMPNKQAHSRISNEINQLTKDNIKTARKYKNILLIGATC